MRNTVLLVTLDSQLVNFITKSLSNEGIKLIHQDYSCLQKNLTFAELTLLDIRECLSNFEECLGFIRRNSKKQKILTINTVENITKSIHAMKSGAKDEIFVPINVKQFISKINKYLNKRRGIVSRIVSIKDNFINTMVNVAFAEEELIINHFGKATDSKLYKVY